MVALPTGLFYVDVILASEHPKCGIVHMKDEAKVGTQRHGTV